MSMDPQGPRASASCTAVGKEAAATEPPVPSTQPVVREQDRLMPVANVSRIMRRALPPHAKISDDTKEVIQDCVSEFISFITGEANERCHAEHRKTVTAEDIMWAMNHLGFDDYVGPLNAFIQRMRESEGSEASRGFGRGSRRGSSLVALHSSQTMRPGPAVCRHPQTPPPAAPQAYAVGRVPRPGPAVYRHPHPPPPAAPQAYAVGRVPRPVPASGAAPRLGGPYQMPGGEQRRPMVPYYGGGAAFQPRGSHGGYYADEASSSNEAPPAPHAGRRHYY